MNAPCKSCIDRCLMCHASCEKYRAYKLEHDRTKEIMKNENYKNFYFTQARQKSMKLAGMY